MVKVAALIAVFNEEETIFEVVKKAQNYVDKVFVVDDGSNDATADRATKAKAVVITNKKNLGKWSALRTGFQTILQNPEVKIIVQLDGDGQHPIEYIPRFIDKIRKGGGSNNWMQDKKK